MKRDPIRCGHCSTDTVRLTHVAPESAVRAGGGPTIEGHLEATCTKCSAVTQIRPTPATLQFDSAGTLCGGWRG